MPEERQGRSPFASPLERARDLGIYVADLMGPAMVREPLRFLDPGADLGPVPDAFSLPPGTGRAGGTVQGPLRRIAESRPLTITERPARKAAQRLGLSLLDELVLSIALPGPIKGVRFAREGGAGARATRAATGGAARGVARGAGEVESGVERLAREVVAEPEEVTIAFHGTGAPEAFRTFDLSKIGTGEGAQAFGHGLYFAENPGVAQSYRAALTSTIPGRATGSSVYQVRGVLFPTGRSGHGSIDTAQTIEQYLGAVQRNDEEFAKFLRGQLDEVIPLRLQREATGVAGEDMRALADFWQTARNAAPGDIMEARGFLYEVKIRAPKDHFLDWDRPLSEQSPWVREALEQIPRETQEMIDDALELEGLNPMFYGGVDDAYSGRDLVRALNRVADAPEEASRMLREAGIPGVRYLDSGSRDPFGAGARQAQRAAQARIRDLESGAAGMTGRAQAQQLERARRELAEAEKGLTRNIVVFDPEIVETVTINGRPVDASEAFLLPFFLGGEPLRPARLRRDEEE